MRILEYTLDLAPYFKSINQEWITDMFELEPIDLQVLDHPDTEIIRSGGTILFVEDDRIGIVGTGALMKTGETEFELTKMGVLKKARGLKAGELLLQALIKKAMGDLGASKLYLLTNRKCEAAIHLYEKNGFVHSAEIMEKYGCEYQRCDVAMLYAGEVS